jgi:hypothetical protein
MDLAEADLAGPRERFFGEPGLGKSQIAAKLTAIIRSQRERNGLAVRDRLPWAM